MGVREQLFEQLLGSMYGISAAQADIISLGGYLIAAFWSLLGGIVFLTYRPSDGHAASLREMSTATDEIAEHPTP